MIRVVVLMWCTWFAAEVSSAERVHVHGFVAQGLIQADGSNYVNDNGGLSASLTELGINVRVDLNDHWYLSSQITYQDNGNRHTQGTRLDYAFIEYQNRLSAVWNLAVQLGRFKNNHWLYSATRDVAHTRPSIILPQSKYYDGFRDVALSSDGVAIQVNRWMPWGDVELRWSRGDRDFDDDETDLILSPLPQGQIKQPYVEQAGAFFTLPDAHLRVGINYLDSTLEYHPAEQDSFINGTLGFHQWMLTLEYHLERFELTSEFLNQSVILRDFFAPGLVNRTRSAGGYIQGRYQLQPKLKTLLRLDAYRRDVSDGDGTRYAAENNGQVPAFFAYQDTLTLGMQYDLSPQWRLQAEVHRVKGTGRLTPALFPNTQVNRNEYWSILAVQLMYWF